MKWRRKYSHKKRWIKSHLINKYGTLCALCNQEMSLKDMSIDHHIPLSRGGADVLDNYRLAHVWCNKMKTNMTPEEFEDFLIV